MRLRLIDVVTRQLVERSQLEEEEKRAKNKGTVVEYGILSHRWLDDADEVKFEDMKFLDVAEKKKGIFKITECCKLAKRDNLKYVWLDTCCIDKSSSAELQESINSMYRWYQEAKVCYAYLKDTNLGPNPPSFEAMQKDEWFKRGWTLQELIAPKHMKFYDANWHYLGTRNSLKNDIYKATGIDLKLLAGKSELQDYSVAERMSWASGRTTTIVEDRSYSLFGIFDVNMPMLYGEGEKAFLRLQEEIIKTSDDHSIFAWSGVIEKYPGLLSMGPDSFKDCGSVKSTSLYRGRSAYTITNRGVSITLNLTQWTLDTYLARIHCVKKETESNTVKPEGLTGIFLRRLDEDDQYARVKVDGLEFLNDIRPPANWRTPQYRNHSREVAIHIRQTELRHMDHSDERAFGFRICNDLVKPSTNGKPTFSIIGGSACQWDDAERTLTVKPGTVTLGNLVTLDIGKQGKKINQIKLCFDFGFNPVIFLAESSAVGIKERIFNKSGQLNFNSDYQYTEEDRNGAKSLSQRSPYDTLGWSSVGEKYASESPLRSGLWALQGHRINGLDVVLSPTEIHVVLKKVKTGKGRLVWDLQIDNMPSGLLRRIFS